MTDEKRIEPEIPQRFGDNSDPELHKLSANRLKSWKSLPFLDNEELLRFIAESFEMMKREHEIQHAVNGHLVQRVLDQGKEIAELKKND